MHNVMAVIITQEKYCTSREEVRVGGGGERERRRERQRHTERGGQCMLRFRAVMALGDCVCFNMSQCVSNECT